MLLNVANSSPELCTLILDTFVDISKEIVSRSHGLIQDYVQMDLKLRGIEAKISQLTGLDGGSAQEKELASLEEEKNRLKSPYELRQ